MRSASEVAPPAEVPALRKVVGHRDRVGCPPEGWLGPEGRRRRGTGRRSAWACWPGSG